MMECADMFATVARCFSPTTEAEWNALTSRRTWETFLAALRFALQDIFALADSRPMVTRMYATGSLQDFLAAPEIDALFDPPSFEEKEAFATKHFNLASQESRESAVPIESLYLSGSNPVRFPLSHRGDQSSANKPSADQPQYTLVHTLATFDGAFDNAFAAPPSLRDACEDHLAVELFLVADLFEQGEAQKAFALIRDHFGWLAAYRRRLMALRDANAAFFVALIDALVGIWVQVEPLEVAS